MSEASCTNPQSAAPAAAATPVLPKSDLNLVWLDCEMTGLNPDHDKIIEIAVVVSSADLQTRIEGPVFAIHQSDALLNGMDAWNKGTHGRSGLIDRVKASTIDEDAAQLQVIEFLRRYVSAKASPMCGNSICQDRRFLYRHMRNLENYFHYRNLDVSTLKELAARWAPDVRDSLKKGNTHLALDDIRESIAELRHYREHFIKV